MKPFTANDLAVLRARWATPQPDERPSTVATVRRLLATLDARDAADAQAARDIASLPAEAIERRRGPP